MLCDSKNVHLSDIYDSHLTIFSKPCFKHAHASLTLAKTNIFLETSLFQWVKVSLRFAILVIGAICANGEKNVVPIDSRLNVAYVHNMWFFNLNKL